MSGLLFDVMKVSMQEFSPVFVLVRDLPGFVVHYEASGI